MNKNVFVVYTKVGCPYCTKVTNMLGLAELQYVEYKLGRDYEYSEFYEKFGESSTFPRVTYNGKLLGGCQETVRHLKENNLV